MGRSDQCTAEASHWLTRDEFEWAYRLGLAISDNARQQPRRPHRGKWKPEPQQERVACALAKASELLASKMTGRPMLSTGFTPDDGRPDLLGGVETRHTTHAATPFLFCWPDPKDPPERPYVLVTGTRYSDLECRGWNLGTWVKQPRFFKRAGEILIRNYRVRDDGFWAPLETLHDPLLERLELVEGEDEAAFLARLADPADLCRYVGRGAFGIRYDAQGRAIT